MLAECALSKTGTPNRLSHLVRNTNEEAPVISVLMPVYNGESFLPRSIRSLQQQTFPYFEVCLLDDGSRDDSFAVAHALVAEDARFKVFRSQHNIGLGASLEVLRKLSSGYWITRLDADDALLPDHLQLRLDYVTRHPGAMILYGGQKVCGGDDWIPCPEDGKPLPVADSAQGATLFIRSSTLDLLGGFAPIRYGEDAELLQRARQFGYRPVRVSFETYLYFRDNPGALTKTHFQ